MEIMLAIVCSFLSEKNCYLAPERVFLTLFPASESCDLKDLCASKAGLGG